MYFKSSSCDIIILYILRTVLLIVTTVLYRALQKLGVGDFSFRASTLFHVEIFTKSELQTSTFPTPFSTSTTNTATNNNKYFELTTTRGKYVVLLPLQIHYHWRYRYGWELLGVIVEVIFQKCFVEGFSCMRILSKNFACRGVISTIFVTISIHCSIACGILISLFIPCALHRRRKVLFALAIHR